MSVLLIIRPRHVLPPRESSRVCVARPTRVKMTGQRDEQTYGRQTVTLCLLLDTASTIISRINNLKREFRSDAKRKVHRIRNTFFVDDVFHLLQFHNLFTKVRQQ